MGEKCKQAFKILRNLTLHDSKVEWPRFCYHSRGWIVTRLTPHLSLTSLENAQKFSMQLEEKKSRSQNPEKYFNFSLQSNKLQLEALFSFQNVDKTVAAFVQNVTFNVKLFILHWTIGKKVKRFVMKLHVHKLNFSAKSFQWSSKVLLEWAADIFWPTSVLLLKSCMTMSSFRQAKCSF